MNHTGNGYALLDSIVLDLGETVKAPGIILDTELDILPVHWPIMDNCVYAEQYFDFPTQHNCSIMPSEDDNPFKTESNVGYWTPCLGYCDIYYDSGPSIRPISMTITGYVQGTARISLLAYDWITGAIYVGGIQQNGTGDGDGWQEVEFDLTPFPTKTVGEHDHGIFCNHPLMFFYMKQVSIISLTARDGGIALLDSIAVKVWDAVRGETTTTTTMTSPKPGDEITTTSDKPDDDVADGGSNSLKFAPFLLLLGIIFL
jgi:hypothetical protein